MLLPNKSLSEKDSKRTSRSVVLRPNAVTTLCGSDNFASFQVPDESVIGRSFHSLANATGKSNGAIICRVCCVFLVLVLAPHMTDAN